MLMMKDCNTILTAEAQVVNRGNVIRLEAVAKDVNLAEDMERMYACFDEERARVRQEREARFAEMRRRKKEREAAVRLMISKAMWVSIGVFSTLVGVCAARGDVIGSLTAGFFSLMAITTEVMNRE